MPLNTALSIVAVVPPTYTAPPIAAMLSWKVAPSMSRLAASVVQSMYIAPPEAQEGSVPSGFVPFPLKTTLSPVILILPPFHDAIAPPADIASLSLSILPI